MAPSAEQAASATPTTCSLTSVVVEPGMTVRASSNPYDAWMGAAKLGRSATWHDGHWGVRRNLRWRAALGGRTDHPRLARLGTAPCPALLPASHKARPRWSKVLKAWQRRLPLLPLDTLHHNDKERPCIPEVEHSLNTPQLTTCILAPPLSIFALTSSHTVVACGLFGCGTRGPCD